MIWAVDIDGVITANPDFWKWWTYILKKKDNNNEIHIISARNPQRYQETLNELKFWGISYDHIHTMSPDLPREYDSQARWKLDVVREVNPQIWLDNEFKVYERVCGISLDTPGTERVLV